MNKQDFQVTNPTLEEAQSIIRKNLVGQKGRIKSTPLCQPYFTQSPFYDWVLSKTNSVETTTAGRLWLVLNGLQKCDQCNHRLKAYYNGILKTCGNNECVNEARSATSKSNDLPRTQKQNDFVKRNLANFLEKSKKTIQERYGVSNPYQIAKVVENAKKCKLDKSLQNKEKRELRHKIELGKRFGVQIDEVQQLDSTWIKYTCECGFSETKTRYTLQNRVNKSGASCLKCSRVSSGSFEQLKLFDFVNSLVPAELNNRRVLPGFEIDIFVPSLNLGIEYNGIFWHSSSSVKNSKRLYHQQKSLTAIKQGIKLVQVWSHWDEEKVKNLLRAKLGKNERIAARRTGFREIDRKEAHRLMSTWHLDGSIGCHRAFALYHDDRPVSLLMVAIGRFSKEHELIRFASAPGISVVGGLSKLVKRSMKEMGIEKLVSFCKLELDGSAYHKAGAELIGVTAPAENWVNLKTGQILTRFSTQKHKLKDILQHFDANKTAHQNLEAHNWRIFWSAGNQKFAFYSELSI